MPACKWCGEPIRFDPAYKSASDKFIPLEEDEDEPHNCPNNPCYSGGSGGSGSSSGSSSNSSRPDSVDLMGVLNGIESLEKKMDNHQKTMLKLVLAVQVLQNKIEKQTTLPFGSEAEAETGDQNGRDDTLPS